METPAEFSTCHHILCTNKASYGRYYGERLVCKTHKQDNHKYWTSICRCGNGYPTFKQPTDQRPTYCGRCKPQDAHHFFTKFCIIENCKNQALYNLMTETKVQYCEQHKTPEMIKILDKRCQESGCQKHPSYNFPGQPKIYCKTHAKEGMVNVVNSKCKMEGCTKNPNFNLPNAKRGLYCSDHKLTGMINIYKKFCPVDDCKGSRAYNEKGLEPTFCHKHKTSTMVKLIGICDYPDCHTIPSYNFPTEKSGIYCNQHKLDGMVNVNSKKCLHPSCTHQPTYNLPTQKTGLYCSSHSLPDMVDVVNPKCKMCSKIPHFNFADKSRAEYCFTHKHPSMIDVAHKRCHLCKYMRANLNYRDDSRNPYCVRCFANTFPEIPKIRKYLCKEKFIANFIKENFPEWTWLTNTIVPDGCSLRRPDMLVDFGSHVLIIEIDEHQHESYEKICENKRSMQLFLDSGSRPMIMIRFNPDQYTDSDSNRHGSCFSFNVKGEMRTTREWQFRSEILIKQIQQWYQDYSREFNYYELFFNSK